MTFGNSHRVENLMDDIAGSISSLLYTLQPVISYFSFLTSHLILVKLSMMGRVLCQAMTLGSISEFFFHLKPKLIKETKSSAKSVGTHLLTTLLKPDVLSCYALHKATFKHCLQRPLLIFFNKGQKEHPTSDLQRKLWNGPVNSAMAMFPFSLFYRAQKLFHTNIIILASKT